MSGSFEKLDVPPTLVSFAVTTGKTGEVVSPEFKAAGHKVCLLTPAYDENGLPKPASLLETFVPSPNSFAAARPWPPYTPGMGGIAEAVMKMGFGNGLGFAFDDALTLDELFGYAYGSFVLEMADGTVGKVLGVTTADGASPITEKPCPRLRFSAPTKTSWNPSTPATSPPRRRAWRPSPMRPPSGKPPPSRLPSPRC